MNVQKWIVILYIMLALSFGLSVFMCITSSQTLNIRSHFIAHAFGAVGNFTYTNSREAFLWSYNRGYRLLEADFQLTKDNHVVLAHDWSRLSPEVKDRRSVTLDTFIHSTVYNKFTPMTIQDLMGLMQLYPDVRIVTDSKYSNDELVKVEFQYIYDCAISMNATNVLDRFIIQIYNEKMLDVISRIYPFKRIWFTLYQRWLSHDLGTLETICRWSKQHHIDCLIMWDYLFTPEVSSITRRYNMRVGVHTVNDVKTATRFIQAGVQYVYTDYL